MPFTHTFAPWHSCEDCPVLEPNPLREVATAQNEIEQLWDSLKILVEWSPMQLLTKTVRSEFFSKHPRIFPNCQGYLSLLRVRGCDLPLNKRIENFRAGSDSGGAQWDSCSGSLQQTTGFCSLTLSLFPHRNSLSFAVTSGILKVMSKMGISCLQSYKVPQSSVDPERCQGHQ